MLIMGTGPEMLQEHLNNPRGGGALANSPYAGASGGAACGDLVRLAVRVEGDRIAEAGFEASGCGTALAAGSAVVELVEGAPLLEAARLSADDVAGELGGLLPSKRHAADLAADAFHRALGAAARAGEARLEPNPRRTLVAMSGGVDSAAAAQLALDAGDEVVAVTLELWAHPENDAERSCCSPAAVIGARALAHSMGIPHFTLDLREAFRAAVVDDFISEYDAGRTPNPCVRCNGMVRFDGMLELAASLGAARLATGHYARIARDDSGPLVAAAVDPRKDQSYMLARLEPETLERLSFPLGELEKPQVRELARVAGLPVADKRESQDLCFLAGVGPREFLRRHGGRAEPGEIVDLDGTVVGRHEGQREFTVGQRRGLSVSAEEPLYVVAKDARRNRVAVGPRRSLSTRRVSVRAAQLHRPAGVVDAVKLRYRQEPIPCRAVPTGDDRVELELEHDAVGVAPGQTACLLRGDAVVGAGVIAAGGDRGD
jgi:tRNA-uridine 2-sulfurtransferase